MLLAIYAKLSELKSNCKEKKGFTFFSFFGYCAEFVDVKNGEKRLLATGQAEMILSDKVDLLHVEKVHLAQERCNRKGGKNI